MRQAISARYSSASARNSLASTARNLLAKITQQQASTERLPLIDFIPAVSPELLRPAHLGPFIDLLQRAIDPGELRAVVAAPPQHGKSEAVIHALLWLCLRHPGKKHGYVTYSAERSEYVSAKFQRLAEQIGLDPQGRLSDVRLNGGSEIRFTSIGGSFTGFTVDGLMIIDDPVKDRPEAESATYRRKAIEWFTDVARSRRHPKTSIVCMATRWHPEDLSGELISRGYQYLNLKAIAEGLTDAEGRVANDPLRRFPGEALFPELKPASFFAEEQQDAYTWSSLYQGEPRGRGASVFSYPDVADGSRFYDVVPIEALTRVTIGLDFAYTAKTHADWSVAVTLAAVGPIVYVVNVTRLQCEPAAFEQRLELLHATYPAAIGAAYIACTEEGSVSFMRTSGLRIRSMSAAKAGDKFARSIKVAAAWNAGKVLLPKSAPWLDTFLHEVCSFTGVKDRHDDQVDAMAAAFDALSSFANTNAYGSARAHRANLPRARD